MGKVKPPLDRPIFKSMQTIYQVEWVDIHCMRLKDVGASYYYRPCQILQNTYETDLKWLPALISWSSIIAIASSI